MVKPIPIDIFQFNSQTSMHDFSACVQEKAAHLDISHPLLLCQLFVSPRVLCLGSRPNAFIRLLKPIAAYPITWRVLCSPGGQEQPLCWRCCCVVRAQSSGIATSSLRRMQATRCLFPKTPYGHLPLPGRCPTGSQCAVWGFSMVAHLPVP